MSFRTKNTLAPSLTVEADSRPRVNAWLVLKSWTYNDVLKLDTAFAENTLTKMDLGNRAVIQPHSAPERLIHPSADKIDINDCTLDGKHTLHATLYTTWQICLFMLLH